MFPNDQYNRNFRHNNTLQEYSNNDYNYNQHDYNVYASLPNEYQLQYYPSTLNNSRITRFAFPYNLANRSNYQGTIISHCTNNVLREPFPVESHGLTRSGLDIQRSTIAKSPNYSYNYNRNYNLPQGSTGNYTCFQKYPPKFLRYNSNKVQRFRGRMMCNGSQNLSHSTSTHARAFRKGPSLDQRNEHQESYCEVSDELKKLSIYNHNPIHSFNVSNPQSVIGTLDSGADHNLRDKLINELRNSTYQCPICISSIRPISSIWSCMVCFHIYHLNCIQSWINKSELDRNGTAHKQSFWRCPSCQTQYETTVEIRQYRCFCGKKKNPHYHPARNSIPHGCDEICNKIRGSQHIYNTTTSNSSMNKLPCPHPCTELCHPGPCPPCVSTVLSCCPCTKVSRSISCGDSIVKPCGQICNRILHRIDDAHDSTLSPIVCAVGLHLCTSICHFGSCGPCIWIIETGCYCGCLTEEILCGSENARKLKFSAHDLEIIRNALFEYSNNVSQSEHDKLSISSLSSLELCRQNSNCSITLDNAKSVCDGDDNVDGVNDDDDDGSGCDNDDDGNLLPSELSILSDNSHESFSITNDQNKDENVNKTCSKLNAIVIRTSIKYPPRVKIGVSFSCGTICQKWLNCAKHKCVNPCHLEQCEPCKFDPKLCFTCPCGRVPLNKLVSSGDFHGDRLSCEDPIPTCPNVCAFPNSLCGHTCPHICHVGLCPPCELNIQLTCRCGRTSKEMTCQQFAKLTSNEGVVEFLCQRVCKKKKQCSRHKCNKKCCNDFTHPCNEVCARRLICKQHNCEDLCHSGPCLPCWRGVIYSEIYCHCGISMLHPPQPCGTIGPDCDEPCSRTTHDCDHPVRHKCHNECVCPPCTVLVAKECPGGHGVHFSLPCFQPVSSCGQSCFKKLPECSHLCQRDCHFGVCSPTSAFTCTQPCQNLRPDCKHPCGLQCHEASKLKCIQAAFPMNSESNTNSLLPCKVLIDLVCSCGKRKQKESCDQVQLKYFVMSQQQEQSSSSSSSSSNRPTFDLNKQPIELLACDESCTEVEDHSRTNPYTDPSIWRRAGVPDTVGWIPFGVPDYPDNMKQFALKNFLLVESVENQLESMIMELANQSSSNYSTSPDEPRTLSHHFPPMKRKHRRCIYELVEFYGMEAVSLDPEPKRHVMVSAKFGIAKMPGGAIDKRASLTSILKKDSKLSIMNASDNISKAISHYIPKSHTSTQFSYAQILKEKRG